MVSTPTTSTTPTYITDARRDPRRADRINVGQLERLLSIVGGGSLVTYGLRRFSVRGIVLAAIGGELIRRGITGLFELPVVALKTEARRGKYLSGRHLPGLFHKMSLHPTSRRDHHGGALSTLLWN